MRSLQIIALSLALACSPTLLIAADSAASTATAPTKVQNVTPDQAEKLIKEQKDVVVLDVRTPEEFQNGHIAGARNVDFQSNDFKQQVAGLDKTKKYVLHCAAGGRSSRALKIFEQQNFAEIYHLNGGLNAWKEAGKPVVK